MSIAPTRIRHRIIAVSMLMAFILYLDRICLGEIVKSASFNNDLHLTKEQIGKILSAFFFTYALFQVPAGWLSDRFGARAMLTSYIVLWSVFTGLTGFAHGFMGLLVARLAWGVVACCAAVSFATDLGSPATWAFTQDVGGRATAAAVGWGNMWGNFGASLSSLMVPWLLARGGADAAAQTTVFLILASAFFLSGVMALGMDATKPLLGGTPVTPGIIMKK